MRPVAHGPGQYADGQPEGSFLRGAARLHSWHQGQEQIWGTPARPSRHVSLRLLTSRRPGRGPRSSGRQNVLQALPERGQRVAIIGCGTSFYMAQSFADLRERSGMAKQMLSPRQSFLPAAPMTLSSR